MRGAIQGKLSFQSSSSNGLVSISELKNARRISVHFLMIAAFIGYIFLSYFYFGTTQNLDFVTTTYFAVVSMMTIGYGDFHAGDSTPSRAFTTFFILLGGGLLGAIVGVYAGSVMDQQERIFKKRIADAVLQMQKVARVATDKVRSIESALEKNFKIRILPDKSRRMTATEYDMHIEEAEHELGFMKSILQKVYNQDLFKKLSDINQALYDEELLQIQGACIVNIVTILVILLVGATGMMFIENWDFTRAVYFTAVTITTCGYGDIFPTNWQGRVYVIFLAIIGCSFAMKGFGEIIRFPMLLRTKYQEMKIAAQFGDQLSPKLLRTIISNEFFDRIPNLKKNADCISRAEFVLMVLQMMDKLSDKDVILISSIFDRLDYNREGILREESLLVELEKAERAKAMTEAELARQNELMRNSGGRINHFIDSMGVENSVGKAFGRYADRFLDMGVHLGSAMSDLIMERHDSEDYKNVNAEVRHDGSIGESTFNPLGVDQRVNVAAPVGSLQREKSSPLTRLNRDSIIAEARQRRNTLLGLDTRDRKGSLTPPLQSPRKSSLASIGESEAQNPMHSEINYTPVVVETEDSAIGTPVSMLRNLWKRIVVPDSGGTPVSEGDVELGFHKVSDLDEGLHSDFNEKLDKEVLDIITITTEALHEDPDIHCETECSNSDKTVTE